MADKRFGGFWRRLMAYVIDRIILYLIALILLLTGLVALKLGGITFGSIARTGELPLGAGLFSTAYIVTTFVTDMIYSIWFHGTIGQTPGKMLLGLRVIRISGEQMTFGIAFLRWVGCWVSGLVFLLGFIWIAFDGRKQGWHDKIAATLVIRPENRANEVVHPTGDPVAAVPPPEDPGNSPPEE